jgi:transposase
LEVSWIFFWLYTTFSAIIVAVAIDRKQLPESADVLQQMVLDLLAQLESEQARREKTEHLLRQLLAARSGRSSERLSEEQLVLFEAEWKAQTAETEDPAVNDPPATPGNTAPGKPRGRRPLPGHLKRETIVHDLAESQKHCKVCDKDLRRIGEEVSERYEYIPAQMLVIEDVCIKYACACTVTTATKPLQPIEKSTAGASLLAQVIVAKYADHLPLNRQQKMFARLGVELSRQTLCGWMGQVAELLDPLYERAKKLVLASKVVQTDDTPVKVLDPSLPKTRTGRIWPYVGDALHPAVVYDYTRTRESAGPEAFLKGYRGYLQADAYSAYDRFFAEPERGMIEVGCWAHARRHFYDARETDPARMGAVLAAIAQLYAVEKLARERGISGEERRILREQGARPALDELHVYLLRIRVELLPKSAAGQAVAYALKNWAALTRYCEDGDLEIDNNAAERSLRGIAVGRNNWTFFGSDNGGKTNAVLRTFVASCERVRIDPWAWFCDVLARIASYPVNRLDELLPHCWASAPP